MTNTMMLDAALWYAQAWPVFPLYTPVFGADGVCVGCSCGYRGDLTKHSTGKHPRTKNGMQDASKDADQVRQWWTASPDANIGVDVGGAGLFVLDFDTDDADFGGQDLLLQLWEAHPTTTQRSGGGGYHLLYLQPDGVTLGNSTKGRLPKAVHCRGVGGYIVAAPSLHESGRRYQWVTGRTPKDIYPRPLPSFLLDLLTRKNSKPVTPIAPIEPIVHTTTHDRYAEAALHGELDKLARTGEGGRNEQLNRSAFALGQLVGAGMLDEGTVTATLSDVARAIGLAEGEATKTLASGLKAGKSKPRDTAKIGATPDLVLDHKPKSIGAHQTPSVQDGEEDDDGQAEDGKRKPKIADLLCSLALANAEMFTGVDGEPYAFCRMGGRRECHRLQSGQFGDFLTALFHERFKTIPGAQQKQDALAMLRWGARETRREVFVRVASYEGRVYIDLGTTKWDAIEVDATGWRIVDTPPVAFRRPKALRPLPYPVPSNRVDLLRGYLNIEPEHWPMLAAWVVAALNARGPYPILVLAGEQGTAKSTTMRVLKSLIDPSAAALRGQPNEVRDLMIGASNSWLMAFDNVSVVHPDVSDALCTISTGGGYAKRALFTDDGELLIDVTRPVALNGIGDVVTRPDLMDRCILIIPPLIPDSQRRDETAFWQAFEQDRPLILGAFLTALSVALRELPNVKLQQLPRMADFAKLAVAAETALKTDGALTFLEAYQVNRDEATEAVIESSPLGDKLRDLVLINGSWEGTATQLLAALNEKATDSERRAKNWPAAPNRLKTPLQRLAPSLRKVGVGVEYDRKRESSKIVLTRLSDSEWRN